MEAIQLYEKFKWEARLMKQVITIEICGRELETEVDFDFIPEVPAYVSGLPEDCYPAEPEQWEIFGILLMDDKGIFSIHVDELVYCIEDELIELLRDTLND